MGVMVPETCPCRVTAESEEAHSTVPRAFPPFWAIPFFLLSYFACTVGLLWVGCGLLRRRARLVINGGALVVGAFMTYWTIFNIVDRG